MVEKRVKETVENTNMSMFTKIKFTKSNQVPTTGIDWDQMTRDAQDKIFEIIEDFRKVDPRFNFVTSKEVLLRSRYKNSKGKIVLVNTNSNKFDENIGFFASEMSNYFNDKYKIMNKKIFKVFNSMEAFNKTKESKEARKYINGFSDALSFDNIYWNVDDNINMHFV